MEFVAEGGDSHNLRGLPGTSDRVTRDEGLQTIIQDGGGDLLRRSFTSV